MPIHFEKLSSAQLEALPKEQVVFFFPVGPLEDHGPHLPMGLDLIHAEALCVEAATRLESELPGWKGIIMPKAPLGIETNTNRFSLRVRGYVLRDWLVDACSSLYRSGFRQFVCFSGHSGPKQLTAIEEASLLLKRKSARGLHKIFQRKAPATLVSGNSGWFDYKDFSRSPLWPDELEHGGEKDTSIALVVAPESVSKGYEELPQKTREDSHYRRIAAWHFGQVEGYWGAPGRGTNKQGAELIQASIDRVFPKLLMVWRGQADPTRLFRTWFSAMPPNRSFFKAWLLFFVLFLLLMAWVYISFQTMIGG